MHTVAETHSFRRAAKDAGMSEDEISAFVSYIAENPTAGDEIVGTGGCRKVRLAGRGKGKSGGYRTITFYTGNSLPVFLLTVFAKGEKVSLTTSERNDLRDLTKRIVAAYEARVAPVAKKGA
ncbi:MAG TPA: type II toxin-antitoxin system RelE/ParE family toxin [Hyphomicrobiaceae bacterium]|nr:type II toxin-antitoxin system RelE/ParE family toxin [Hyphomicrobiaceae bacterium]